MAATGLNKERLTEAIISRLKADIGAMEQDKDEKDTPLRKMASIIAEEVIEEMKRAIVTVNIPAGQVIVSVLGGAGAPAAGVPNSAPIQADNSISGGLS